MNSSQACSCGGKLSSAKLQQIDLLPIFGLRGVIEGPISGLRCAKCKIETFDGVVFNRLLFAVAGAVLRQARILSTEEARFLRKAVLGLTQARLAERMSINPVTVADWERGERPLSKEHDYELRGISLASLMDASEKSGAVGDLAKEILNRPRTVAPPRRPRRYVLQAADLPAA